MRFVVHVRVHKALDVGQDEVGEVLDFAGHWSELARSVSKDAAQEGPHRRSGLQ